MVPLALLSLATVYLVIERLLVLRKTRYGLPTWLGAAKLHLMAQEADAFQALLQENPGALATLLQAAAHAGSYTPDKVARQLPPLAKQAVDALEHKLPLLATIAGAAPMLGFLGTVTGMIRAFFTISQAHHHISPQLLSTGIYEAMVTTATGLVVGIIAYLGYNYLAMQVNNEARALEHVLDQFLIDLTPTPHAKA